MKLYRILFEKVHIWIIKELIFDVGVCVLVRRLKYIEVLKPKGYKDLIKHSLLRLLDKVTMSEK